MAEWIKVEKHTLTKPEVIQLADILGVSHYAATGHLVAFWSWCDDNLSGPCPVFSGTSRGLDMIAGLPGFADAMVAVGWLTKTDGVYSVPNFENHMGESAKTRAKDTERRRRARQTGQTTDKPADKPRTKSGQCPNSVPPKSGPEERREEKNVSNTNTDAGACENLTPQKPEPQARQPSEADTLVQDLGQPAEPIVIPDRMKTPEILGAARKWFRHLGQVARERVPEPGSEQLREFWRHYGAIGPERFVAAVDFSIARGYKNLIEERPEYEGRDLRGGAVGSASPAQRREANNAAAFAAVFGSHPNDWPKFGHVVRRETDRIHNEPTGDVGGDPQLLPG
jgi:hypothetical protein